MGKVNVGMVTSSGTRDEDLGPANTAPQVEKDELTNAQAELVALQEEAEAEAAELTRDPACFDTLEAKVSAIAERFGVVLKANDRLTAEVMAAVNEFAVNFNSDIRA